MFSFTKAYMFAPVVLGPFAGQWMAGQGFRFFERDDKTGPSVAVQYGDRSNGADIPPPHIIFAIAFCVSALLVTVREALIIGLSVTAVVAWLLPRIHAEYIKAVFVHDIGLTKFRHRFSRLRIDFMFLKAMRVERWPLAVRPSLALSFQALRAGIVWAGRDVPHWLWRLARPYLLFIAVAFWGLLKERHHYFRARSRQGVLP